MVDPIAPCSIKNLPPLVFEKISTNLTDHTLKLLDSIVNELNYSPHCNIKIYGYYSKKSASQKSLIKTRIENIANYFITHGGIAADRVEQYIEPASKTTNVYFKTFP